MIYKGVTSWFVYLPSPFGSPQTGILSVLVTTLALVLVPEGPMPMSESQQRWDKPAAVNP
jgi:hypothetical protein